MIITAYRPFTKDITTFQQAKITDLTMITEYRYKRHFYEIGEFSLTVPETDPGDLMHITPGCFLHVKDEYTNDSLYVTKVTVKDRMFTFSGYDLKYLLTQRITLFPQGDVEAGTYGYDCRKGTTGSIIEGYVNYNAGFMADAARKFPNFNVTATATGIANDTYMSRLQPLNEVVEALCKNAKIGYDVHMDIGSSTIWMNVFEGEDRGYVFGNTIGNVLSETYVSSGENEKSTVWAVNGTGTDNSTVTAVHLNAASIKEGYERKETVAGFNCETEDVEIYARHEAEECTASWESTVSADGLDYGSGYLVGDKVRLGNTHMGMLTDARVIAVEKNYSGHNRRINVFFADCDKPVQTQKILNHLADNDRRREKDIIDQKLDGGGSGGGGGGLTASGEIRFTAGRLYIGDEEYRLQRGSGRRIIAVTQGKKCAQIYADTESESEAAAIAAVIAGLDEAWDIEFDKYIGGDGWSYKIIGQDVYLAEYSSIEIDWGDGSETFKGTAETGTPYHTYKKQGIYRIRIKTDAKELSSLNPGRWGDLKDVDQKRWNEGVSVYIGGEIEAAYNASGYSGDIGRLTWGESVKYISGFQFIANELQKDRLDISLPPFFVGAFKNGEKTDHVIFSYAHLDYLYIPASCIYIPYHGFQGVSLSALEIEPEGEMLEIGSRAFWGSSSSSTTVPHSEIRALDIPARVSFGYGGIFGEGGEYFGSCGIRVIRLQSGIISIPEQCFHNCNSADDFTVGNFPVVAGGRYPLYIFIPKTVTSIEKFAFDSAVNILYEGSSSEWESINKDPMWRYSKDSECKIEYCNGDLERYGAFNFLVANVRGTYSGGQGITVSGDGTISLKPANEGIGGVDPHGDGFDYSPDTGFLRLKNASKDEPGIIKIGKGIQITTDPQTGKGGGADVLLGKGMRFETIVDENGKVTAYPISLDLDKSLKFNDITDEQTGEIIQSKLALDTGSGLTFEKCVDSEGIITHKLAANIGNGLTFEEHTDASGNTLKKIVPNLGQNLEIDANGKINAKGGGTVLTPGDGVDIQNDVIRVKIDGDTIKFNENKELTAAGGVVIDKAVIIKEAESKYILHNFTQVEYLAGNKIGYAGSGNQIIVNGYVFLRNRTDFPKTGSAPYTSAVFSKAGKTADTMIENVDVRMQIISVSTITASIRVGSDALGLQSSPNSANDLSRSGIGFTWSAIYPPSEQHSFGYVSASAYLLYGSSGDNLTRGNSINFYVDFASEAEYEAAVGLTYEPLTLTRVEDNPTVV